MVNVSDEAICYVYDCFQRISLKRNLPLLDQSPKVLLSLILST